MLETPLAPPPHSDTPTQQDAPPSLDPLSNQIYPASTSSPQQENLPAEEPESGPMLLLSESLQESPGAEAARPEQNLQTEPQPDPVLESAAEPVKPKRDKLTRLKELGLEPPPVAKLRPDDGAFVQLEPSHCNPG